jgi:hypothetical protein
MSKELETLRAELHKEVDAKIDKLIKPEFKNNVWYKYTNSKIHLVCFNDVENREGYGFDLGGFNNGTTWSMSNLIPATPTEVQQALEKEAVNRGFKGGVSLKEEQKKLLYLKVHLILI